MLLKNIKKTILAICVLHSMASLLTAYPLFSTNNGYLVDSDDYDNEQLQNPFGVGPSGTGYLVKKSLSSSSSSFLNEQDERKLASSADESDGYLENLAKVFIDYGRLLKNPQLQMSQKQFLFYRFNNLMLKMKKYFSEYPENEVVFEKILKKLNSNQADGASENESDISYENKPERMPFKWG